MNSIFMQCATTTAVKTDKFVKYVFIAALNWHTSSYRYHRRRKLPSVKPVDPIANQIAKVSEVDLSSGNTK
jgi:hypothetical protein